MTKEELEAMKLNELRTFAKEYDINAVRKKKSELIESIWEEIISKKVDDEFDDPQFDEPEYTEEEYNGEIIKCWKSYDDPNTEPEPEPDQYNYGSVTSEVQFKQLIKVTIADKVNRNIDVNKLWIEFEKLDQNEWFEDEVVNWALQNLSKGY